MNRPPDGHWSGREDDLLHELPHAAQVLYLRGMRRFVDRQGIVGLARRVSERSMIETLVVPVISGRHHAAVVEPTRKMVRYLLDVLVKAGMVERLPARGAFVFRLPHAAQEKSVSGRKGQESSDGKARVKPHAAAAGKAMKGQPKDGRKGPPQNKSSQAHTVESACRLSSRARARVLGELCAWLQSEAGMLDAHPGRVELVRALDDGIDPAVIASTAVEIAAKRTPNVGYVLATIRGRQADIDAGRSSRAPSNRRMSVCDRAEQQRARFGEASGHVVDLHLIRGGRDE